ncbi:hypothetical protein GQ600_27199 [Phytophthora cactorum]|nr:hypothetical protein GQ600_27199 [Phytophthora cactorum]
MKAITSVLPPLSRNPEALPKRPVSWSSLGISVGEKGKSVWNLEQLCQRIDGFKWFAESGDKIFPSIAKLARQFMSSFLPNPVYYPQLATMDAAGLRSTLSNVLLYGLFEFISILVREFVLNSPVFCEGSSCGASGKWCNRYCTLYSQPWSTSVREAKLFFRFNPADSFQFAWQHQPST